MHGKKEMKIKCLLRGKQSVKIHTDDTIIALIQNTPFSIHDGPEAQDG